ncbi:hypothetical protein [Gilvimarinus agarilyticus]|uniref:hypothetical protein n=1 Tax=Gilvimarinus agarilyticus TaxID=679259 RepID=UPI0005A01BE4|nr:hypothetical protein [Gilvimarinus agarilyticus]
MNKITVVIVGIGLACIALVTYLYGAGEVEHNNSASIAPPAAEVDVSPTAIVKPLVENAERAALVSSDADSEAGATQGDKSTPHTLMDNYAELHEQHGYYDDVDLRAYDNYSDETLHALGGGGDVRALLKLSERYARRLEPEASRALLMEAAARGATSALVTNAISISSRLLAGLYDEQESNTAIYEVLAMCEVSSRMGNNVGCLDFREGFVEDNNFIPTERDREIIDSRADAIYESLNKKRRALGLGDFDGES